MLMYCNVHKNKGKLKFNWKKKLTTADTKRIVGGRNCGPADKPCQNQIEFLMGASFIQWILLCIDPLMYWCLNKTGGFKESYLHELHSFLT